MELGAFSVSLSVKNLDVSMEFYKKLGFKVFHGDPAENWVIMKNGSHVIGLFQGMFEKNMLTFNPGWDQDAKQLDSFTDVRELYQRLKEHEIAVTPEIDESSKGPCGFAITDPDGNPILIDQHI